MPSARAHRALPALLITAGLAVAGCGGGGGGDEATYVKTYEASCKSIVDATKELTNSTSSLAAQAGSDPDKAVASLKAATTKLFDTFGTELKKLADADAPDKFSDFQDSIKDTKGKTEDAIAKAKSEVAKISSLQDFSTLGEKLDGIKIDGGKDLPKELREKAPSCATLDRS